MRTDELTNMTNRVPKVINPAAHAVADYVSAGAMIATGFALRHRNRRAANFAFANGAGIIALSMITDYPGGLFPRINFRNHGAVDMILAALTAAGPALLGFGSTSEAQVFYGQAAAETAVIAATDWGGADGRLLSM